MDEVAKERTPKNILQYKPKHTDTNDTNDALQNGVIHVCGRETGVIACAKE
jgi:hypothetical protein